MNAGGGGAGPNINGTIDIRAGATTTSIHTHHSPSHLASTHLSVDLLDVRKRRRSTKNQNNCQYCSGNSS